VNTEIFWLVNKKAKKMKSSSVYKRINFQQLQSHRRTTTFAPLTQCIAAAAVAQHQFKSSTFFQQPQQQQLTKQSCRHFHSSGM